MQEIWVGTKPEAPNDEKPTEKAKNPTKALQKRLNAWYLGKKELNKEKLNERENAVGSEA